jgi:hypothetical protein
MINKGRRGASFARLPDWRDPTRTGFDIFFRRPQDYAPSVANARTEAESKELRSAPAAPGLQAGAIGLAISG